MTAFYLSTEQVERVITLYKSGGTLDGIGSMFGVSRGTISNYLKRNNVSLRNNLILESTKVKIKEMYVSGVTNKELAKIFCLNRCTIQTILKNAGVELRPQTETSRKHVIVENYFVSIDSKEKAYFLGLLYADGSIRRNALEISLIYTDFEPLYRLSKVLYGKCLLKFRPERVGFFFNKEVKTKCKAQWRLLVGSKKLVNDLKSHGLTERKSLTKRYPNIPKEFDKHFIRGYFDGNGFISKATIKRNSCAGFVSATKFCEDLKERIEEYLHINCILSDKIPGISNLRVFGMIQLEKFLDWIYEDSDVHILRKYDKYRQLFSEADSTGNAEALLAFRDEFGYIVETPQNEKILVMSTHGLFYIADKSEIEAKIKEYSEAIINSQKAIELLT